MNNSEPAFPNPDRPHTEPGMSLRDYFAGQVLVGWQMGDEFAAWRRNQYEGGWGGNLYVTTTDADEIARGCYCMADAMMRARGAQ